MLAPHLRRPRSADITEENIQARTRGLMLMAISNKFGHMVLTTGNKSEMSVGYATLYGDMCGGYLGAEGRLQDHRLRAVALAQPAPAARRPRPGGPRHPRARHHQAADAPSSSPTRPTRTRCRPTTVLDAILDGLIEDEARVDDIVARGYDRGDGAAGLAHARPRRVQAPPGAAGREDHPPRLRPRPPLSDHQRLHRSGMTVTVRFAPSPTGLLHVGNAAHGAGQLAVRPAPRRPLPAALRRYRPRALAPRVRRRHRGGSALARPDVGQPGAPVGAARRLRAAVRAAARRRPALSPATRRRRSWSTSASASSPRGRPPVYDRAALEPEADERRRLEAEGRRPHWRFLLEAGSVVLGRSGARPVELQARPHERSGAGARRRHAFSTRCRRWSTTSTSPSPTSSAATTMSPTPRCRSRCSSALGAAPPAFAHLPLLTDIGGEGLSKRLGSMSIASCATEGIEAMALNAIWRGSAPASRRSRARAWTSSRPTSTSPATAGRHRSSTRASSST